MSESKKSLVTVVRGVDKSALMEEFAGRGRRKDIDSRCPERRCEIPNERKESLRSFNVVLTEEEAARLRDDPRIMGVRWGSKAENGVKPEPFGSIASGGELTAAVNYFRGDGLSNDAQHWGLLRHRQRESQWGSGAGNALGTINPRGGKRGKGAGVDVVIIDSGLAYDHPEFLDESGNTRLNKIDWRVAAGIDGDIGAQDPGYYEDTTFHGGPATKDVNGHGTAMSSVAYGNTLGVAPGANVYIAKTNFSYVHLGDPPELIFNMIRLWHLSKIASGNFRPTVVSCSFGSVGGGNVVGGVYRGVPWDAGGSAPPGNFPQYGLGYGTFNEVAAWDAEMEELNAAGVISVSAAGNFLTKIDSPSGRDYNNIVYLATAPSVPVYYHRGPSPIGDRSAHIRVGILDSLPNGDGMETRGRGWAPYGNPSCGGPGVDIYAAGSMTPAAADRNSLSGGTPAGDWNNPNLWPRSRYRELTNSDFFGMISVTGTSPASPLVAGAIALMLEQNPTLTPRQVKSILIRDWAYHGVLHSTGLDDDYGNVESLLGGPNRILRIRPSCGTIRRVPPA